MKTERLTAFTDGVVAIIITIMVLELKVPSSPSAGALIASLPLFATYALSYVHVGLYWANHHHMLHATDKVDGRVLWANLFWLFWLSLVPFVIRWVDEAGFGEGPVATFGFVMLATAMSWFWLQRALVAANGGDGGTLARALGRDRKGRWSGRAYVVAIAASFWEPAVAMAIYVAIAIAWFIPDRRFERALDV